MMRKASFDYQSKNMQRFGFLSFRAEFEKSPNKKKYKKLTFALKINIFERMLIQLIQVVKPNLKSVLFCSGFELNINILEIEKEKTGLRTGERFFILQYFQKSFQHR